MSKEWKPKEKIWLALPTKRGEWCYALARYEDGSIRVVESYSFGGFSGVGNNGAEDKEDLICYKLCPGERNMILKDLYWACKLELEKKKLLGKNGVPINPKPRKE